LGLSLVLLIGAALLIRSLVGLATMDLGFRPENVLVANIQLPDAKYPDEQHSGPFFASLLERLRGLAGVRSAAVVYNAYSLTERASGEVEISVPGQPKAEGEDMAKAIEVSPDFFRTMGLTVLRGRTFTERDEEGVVIDETLARRYFPDSDPVGQRLNHGHHNQSLILGVVNGTRDLERPEARMGVVYRPGRVIIGVGVVLVRTEGDPVPLAAALRGQVAALEKDQVIKKLAPLQTMLSETLAPRRFVMVLLSVFAGIALALATVGVYGLLQYSTTRQTHDIGIRMALGATRVDVLRVVMRQGLRLTLIGVVVGVGGAVAVTRVLSSLLYGVTPTDPATLVLVSCVLVVVALVASYLPARRAARVDPMVALRYE
jgi:putative ABC transport system permease protein